MKKEQWTKIVFIFTGLASVIWFFIRVIPKPSRAAYPCQRAAFPLASSFVLWLTGAAGFAVVYAAFKKFAFKHRMAIGVMLSLMVVFVGCSAVKKQVQGQASTDSANMEQAVGTPRGVNPGRVVWAYDSSLISWDDEADSGDQYWSDDSVDQEKLDRILSESIRALAVKNEEVSDVEAWEGLFSYSNSVRGKGESGYMSGEKIAVKINLNNQDNPYADENVAIDASPHMVLALLKQLVNHVGAAPGDIYVYDALRPISDPVLDLCRTAFPEVHFIGGLGYPNKITTEFAWTSDVIHYSNGRISDKEASSVPAFLLDADYIVNMAILKSHGSITGVTLCGKNHYGSIGDPARLHNYTHPGGDGRYSPQVDIFGHKEIWQKTVLYMIDGLFGAVGRSGCVDPPEKWNSAPFNGWWPSSLFVSQDIVAIDSVGLDFLTAETDLRPYSDGYLHEAALADNPPSGTVYDPENDGVAMVSLGVHEHWNNPEEKQYKTIDLIPLSY